MKIRVQYDAYNRQFMLMESGSALRDGDIYLVMDDPSVSDYDYDADMFSDDEYGHA